MKHKCNKYIKTFLRIIFNLQEWNLFVICGIGMKKLTLSLAERATHMVMEEMWMAIKASFLFLECTWEVPMKISCVHISGQRFYSSAPLLWTYVCECAPIRVEGYAHYPRFYRTLTGNRLCGGHLVIQQALGNTGERLYSQQGRQ